MGKESSVAETKDKKKTLYRRDIKKGYMILYLSVVLVIVLCGVILYFLEGGFSFVELLQNIFGNLMGVFGAFLVFDIAHEKLSKDSYAGEVSEQILDTLMYHPEAMELYENEQKKKFVNAFIHSIVDDPDASEMIVSQLDTYLLTPEDFEKKEKKITEKDCRIRTEFSYRFVLDAKRSNAFSGLRAPKDPDPYFYVQEELDYKTKYLSQKGNNLCQNEVTLGYIYDSASLDRFLRGNTHDKNDSLLTNCIFRESLDIEEVDRKMFEEYNEKKDEESKKKLIGLVQKMFRPHLVIDRCKGKIIDVNVFEGGVFVKFWVGHDTTALEHSVSIVFHMPKKWNSILEVVLVEPTKEPKISVSYEEDEMDVEMYAFLNKSEASAYDNAYESENGVYGISLTGEWVFPISGVVFPVKRDARKEAAQKEQESNG